MPPSLHAPSLSPELRALKHHKNECVTLSRTLSLYLEGNALSSGIFPRRKTAESFLPALFVSEKVQPNESFLLISLSLWTLRLNQCKLRMYCHTEAWQHLQQDFAEIYMKGYQT
jgi:hypothetical protein